MAEAAVPVLVWTMGKVGSISITRTLEALALPVRHIHNITVTQFRQITKDQPVTIITLVRDPMLRNVSAFFQNIEMNAPNWRTMPAQVLANVFIATYNHAWPSQWYARQIGRMTKLIPGEFDKDRRWSVWSNSRARCLVMRLDLPDSEKAARVSKFLDLEVASIPRSNTANEKDYASQYEGVLGAEFPEEIVSRVYDSDFARFFWKAEEIDVMRARWKTRPARGVPESRPATSTGPA